MIYKPLELGPRTATPCPNAYNDEATLICPGARRLVLQIAGENRAVIQLGVMQQGKGVGKGSVTWQAEEPYLPVVASLARHFDAVRVRNWAAGEEAEVLINVA